MTAESGTLFAGVRERALFGALLVALQFFFYDCVKSLLHVSVNDLDVWWDVMAGVSGGGG